jgi:hypothetical protein
MLDEDKLEDDLTHVAAWCEYQFPHIENLRLFAAAQKTPVPDQLAVAVADTLRTTKLDGPVVAEARRALIALGYSFDWIKSGDIYFISQVSAQELSAHERMQAIALFTRLGLT